MLVKVENCRSLRIWNLGFLRCHESPAALLHGTGLGNSWDSLFCFRAVQALASLLKSSKKHPDSASCIVGGCFCGVEPAHWGLHWNAATSSTHWWWNLAQVKGARRFCVLITILGAAWLSAHRNSFSPFHIGTSKSQNLRVFPPPDPAELSPLSGQHCSFICSPAATPWDHHMPLKLAKKAESSL